jgi:hypothetical protein
MLISHKHKFIAIDIPKTGTTSINNAIYRGGIMEKYDFTVEMSQKAGLRHATYDQCIKKFPTCKNYFAFTFVRNPWDRFVSCWFFKKYNARHTIPKNLPLKEFLLNILATDQKTQHSYIRGFTNNSFVGRFESLQEDFNMVCDKIGIPQQKLPHTNKTNHKHYAEYYDDETRKIVAEKYARDIEYFGYKFGYK